jgi:hypothetical protein
VSNALRLFLLPPVVLLLASCSRPKTITFADLRSHLLSAISATAEAESFIDYVQQNRSTREFARGHVTYLADEVNRSAEELHESAPGAVSEENLQKCRLGLDALSSQLSELALIIGGDTAALATSKERIEKLRHMLQETNSSL